ncbi:aminodeoxychorismate/anthranilate synthase component II [Robertmurraya korlensis]|uniref:anthranilate synthase component II n=1 Tax=Robertmurraya korlensis TaxID=519977 RepID=UPI00203EB723|nr:aminodeoxychorismate/anthranilate synthase component II [Robertmurraya korlensis]MCM3601458.1 aminodeoxychorismate/anthranilate synthase component II [Robertmurraya korlensis]
MILLIDNYDSFTFNLYQYLGELGEQIVVKRNDSLTVEDIIELSPKAIVISPGPGRPEHAGICIEVIQQLYTRIPILGICLGHQAIGHAFGATVSKAKEIMHGKISKISHEKIELFKGFEEPLEVMRYHSLVIEKATLPSTIQVLATSIDDGEIMAIKHKEAPLYGFQFHPESVGTESGKKLIQAFLTSIGEEFLNERVSTKTV